MRQSWLTSDVLFVAAPFGLLPGPLQQILDANDRIGLPDTASPGVGHDLQEITKSTIAIDKTLPWGVERSGRKIAGCSAKGRSH
jgi:hypothetical protein